MRSVSDTDAIVVGSGPNGLAAAVALAEAGLKVVVLEQADTLGGGARTAELMRPGCFHDICSAVHPMTANSPFFRRLPLDQHGLKWVTPPVAMAHPFDDGTAAALHQDIAKTAETLGDDARRYEAIFEHLVRVWPRIEADVLAPFRFPRHPFEMVRFGLAAIRSAAGFANGNFKEKRARALFAGLAAHSGLPLTSAVTSGIALVLAAQAHVVSWPFPAGGAGKITQALSSHLASLGGEVRLSSPVTSFADLEGARVVLFDLTPRQILALAADRFPSSYRRQLEEFRYGMGVFKLDFITSAPIPFAAEACRNAGTVHLGGSFEEIAQSEQDIWDGRHSDKPFVLLSQPSVFDPCRAPKGLHIVWSYCHVPAGSEVDMTDAIEAQIERFAPGFRRVIVEKKTMTTRQLESYNPNYFRGDINGGMQNWRQLFTRPAIRLNPYTTPDPRLYICSSSTPPGGGVHGMCGYHAAHTALDRINWKTHQSSLG